MFKLAQHLPKIQDVDDDSPLIINKCRPILVEGLKRGIEINFHINKIYGSVAKWIKCWAGELILSQGDFFT